MSEPLRWGILGTGTIAVLFAEGLKTAKLGRLHAVGSRSKATAEAFGARFDCPRRHADYRQLVEDPEVEAVYVATPHSLHRECALLALNAGKHVLCEKPFAINRAQAGEVVAVARAHNLFLMEAMWTRFFPLMHELRSLARAGEIGDVRIVEADFGFRSDPAESPRLFDPAFGGGSLLDVGVYAVSFASMLLGKPDRVAAMAELGPTCVDEQIAAILGHPGGALAVCKSSIRVDTPQEATLVGTTGRIRVHSPFWRPSALTISREGAEDRRVEIPFEGNGYHYEADEVARRVRAGDTESPIMPLNETLEIMGTMDAIRARCGLRYPME